MQKKQISGIWESRSAEFWFYYIEKKMENVIRRSFFYNMLCFLWNIRLHNTVSKMKTSEETHFHLWSTNNYTDHLWTPGSKTFVLCRPLAEGRGVKSPKLCFKLKMKVKLDCITLAVKWAVHALLLKMGRVQFVKWEMIFSTGQADKRDMSFPMDQPGWQKGNEFLNGPGQGKKKQRRRILQVSLGWQKKD